MLAPTDYNALPTQEYASNSHALDREIRSKHSIAKVVEISSVESAAAPLSESETEPGALVFDWYDSKKSAATVARVVGIKPGQLLVETRMPIKVSSVVRAVGQISTKSGSRKVEGRLLVAKCVSRLGGFQISLAFKEVRCGNLSSDHPMKVLDQSSRLGVPAGTTRSHLPARNEESPRGCERAGTDAVDPATGMNEAETRTAGVVMLRVCEVRQ